MTLYLDASVLVALITTDAWSSEAADLVRAHETALVSEWTLAETQSALNRAQRVGILDASGKAAAVQLLSHWKRRGSVVNVLSIDVVAARELLERTDSALKTPDGLHLAIAARKRATIATFDGTLAAAAREAGVEVARA